MFAPSFSTFFTIVVLLITLERTFGLFSRYVTPGLFPLWLKALIWKKWYDFMAKNYPQEHWTMMNYGYHNDERKVDLKKEDEWERYAIQMYDYVSSVSSGGGKNSLAKKKVLEVGCGRGGGAAWLSKTKGPSQVVGLDFSKTQIEFCEKRHCKDKKSSDDADTPLRFVHGDALALPFPDNSFDHVLSVESSHCYADMKAFLAEVNRVLVPGGSLLFADFRSDDEVEMLKEQLSTSAMHSECWEDMTPCVLAALDLDHERKVKDCLPMVPPLLRGFVSMFIGTKGSQTYQNFKGGKWSYYKAVLVRK
jgi:ubiquinone/menaquinone biosynthesis C-methylase UbiE